MAQVNCPICHQEAAVGGLAIAPSYTCFSCGGIVWHTDMTSGEIGQPEVCDFCPNYATMFGSGPAGATQCCPEHRAVFEDRMQQNWQLFVDRNIIV